MTERGKHNSKVMNRFALTKRLVAKLATKEAVIGGIGNSNFDCSRRASGPEFLHAGKHGAGGAHRAGRGAGAAKRRVFALEGDGSILMQLGSLATIANVAPPNLTVVVWDNGMYQITGSSRPRRRDAPTWSRSRAGRGSNKAPGRTTRRISIA
jgi:thiamine pyrophosphate-dependent acetolactate synthase large subunit-like protein